jgi:hypothetical protein
MRSLASGQRRFAQETNRGVSCKLRWVSAHGCVKRTRGCLRFLALCLRRPCPLPPSRSPFRPVARLGDGLGGLSPAASLRSPPQRRRWYSQGPRPRPGTWPFSEVSSRGRDDVCAVRWEGREGGRSGYLPACRWEWNRAYGSKPEVKCGECERREFLPSPDKWCATTWRGGARSVCTRSFQVRPNGSWPWTSTRLPGRRTWLPFSVLPTRCRCLSPWDGPGWATVLTCGSSSGSPCPRAWRGTWGATHLTCIMERWHQVGLDLIRPPFPDQDTMPKGGFDKLIALPLPGRTGARWEQRVSAVPLTTACRCERLSGKAVVLEPGRRIRIRRLS